MSLHTSSFSCQFSHLSRSPRFFTALNISFSFRSLELLAKRFSLYTFHLSASFRFPRGMCQACILSIFLLDSFAPRLLWAALWLFLNLFGMTVLLWLDMKRQHILPSCSRLSVDLVTKAVVNGGCVSKPTIMWAKQRTWDILYAYIYIQTNMHTELIHIYIDLYTGYINLCMKGDLKLGQAGSYIWK